MADTKRVSQVRNFFTKLGLRRQRSTRADTFPKSGSDLQSSNHNISEYDTPPPPYEGHLRQQSRGFYKNRKGSRRDAGQRERSNTSAGPSARTQNVDELPEDLTLLAALDTVFIIDDSASMNAKTGVYKDQYTHWEQTLSVVKKIVPLCATYDDDGVDIYFLNAIHSMQNVKDPEKVERLFKLIDVPRGSTPTARRIKEICEPYLQACERAYVEAKGHPFRKSPKFPKPRNCIVITDGQADNPYDLFDTIVDFAQRLDAIDAPQRQLGFQFFQVGDMPGVSQHLNDLDNAIRELIISSDSQNRTKEIRDIVDTVPGDRLGTQGLTDAVVIKTVIGAVSRTFDEKMILQYVPAAKRKIV